MAWAVVQEHVPGVALQQGGGWWEGPREATWSARARGQPLPEARNVFLRMSCQLPRMVLHATMNAPGQENIIVL